MFNALVIDKPEGQYSTKLTLIADSELMPGDVEVDISYSTLNYKDALAITGKAPVVRRFPMVPGIDFVGTVSLSSHPDYQAGQQVILNGWGVGETHLGGLAQKARVNGDWLVPLPKEFSAKQAMAIGTAGYTAMLCVQAIQSHGVTPQNGPILVTGATGGVGSVAIALLAKQGYDVLALSGRGEQEADYLKTLGASAVVPRSELETAGKPLQKERWAAVIDVAGSHVLANACAATRYGGVVAACGLAGGMDFPATVAPFILRGVTLVGVDSVMCPKPKRLAAWQGLAKWLDPEMLDCMTQEIGLSEAQQYAAKQLDGKVRGRIVVDVNR